MPKRDVWQMVVIVITHVFSQRWNLVMAALFYPIRLVPNLLTRKLFPVLRLRAAPVGTARKVMMTMTTSTAATASPWRLPPITTTAITSQPLQESRVSKSGILDTDLERTLLLPVLREIPTGIFSHPPSAAVDEFFIDDNDRTLPHLCLYPSPTLEERSPTLQLSRASAAVNEPFEYQSQLVKLTTLFD